MPCSPASGSDSSRARWGANGIQAENGSFSLRQFFVGSGRANAIIRRVFWIFALLIVLNVGGSEVHQHVGRTFGHDSLSPRSDVATACGRVD